ncbi:Alpha-enolase [Microtus ochrogaster]|uniref:phosphopyruvate hydratase n=1 Tax=Microtus ochrogaster TaxID=79684 RepID=A0A8J6G1S1_MICOH|nr:Alpha-enolase [Microtus ochrogaster]
MVIGAEVYLNLKKVIKEKYRKSAISVSKEDIKFAPNTLENKEVPEGPKNAIAKASYTVISIEVSASVFSRSGKYGLDFKSLVVTPDQLLDLHKSFIWE